MCLLTGRAHPALAEDVAKELGIKLCQIELKNFADGEISCRISQSIRGDDVFIVQPHCGNVNDALMEQMIIIDAAKRASAGSITAVCPLSWTRYVKSQKNIIFRLLKIRRTPLPHCSIIFSSRKTRAIWWRLGAARDWVFKIRITDPVKVVIAGASIDAKVGK